MLEVNLEIEAKGKESPLSFLNALKEFLAGKKSKGEIENYSILLPTGHVNVDEDFTVLDTTFLKDIAKKESEPT